MSVAVYHPRMRAQPSLNRVLGVSFVLHILVLVVLSLTFSASVRMSPSSPIQVRLVGVPQPAEASRPKEKPEQVRTQDSAAPKEPPPEMKNIPPSEAKTKFLQEVKEQPKPEDKPNPIEAKERPPVLDKNPDKKKVVKNDLSAKVVKNPEDFLAALDYVDKLEKANPIKTKAPAIKSDKPAGEGPQLQLNMADQGTVDAIRQYINRNWLIPPGKDTRGLQVIVQVSLAADGNLTALRVVQSSGDTSFDNSLIRAIRKSVPLPIPMDKYDKFKELELAFAPAAS